MALNPKQKRFCEEYVIDFNATKAAERAGYSVRTANEQGARLLVNVSVKQYIKELQAELKERSGITADMIIQEIAKVGFANIQDFIESSNGVKDLSKIDKQTAAAIASIKVTEIATANATRTTTEFKLHDKLNALQMLGRNLGIFEKDNSQKKLELPEIILPGGG